LVNLLSNSLKFTKSNGIIKIEASVSEQNTTIAVSDNGCGIEENKLN